MFYQTQLDDFGFCLSAVLHRITDEPDDCFQTSAEIIGSVVANRVYEMEKRINTPRKYLFPNFETLHWFVFRHVYDILKGKKWNQ